MSPKLTSLLNFMQFINKFKLIKRTVFVGGENPNRQENDAEHSFELAMTAWYFIDSLELKLDLNKVLKYALVHDLVEVYAGDIDAFMYPNQDISKIKSQNEAAALIKIKNEFLEFPELIQWIENYEHKTDEESLFTYVLDKVIGDFGWSFIYGGTLQECGISEKAMLARRDEKIAQFPLFLEYYNEVLAIWQQKPGYFADCDFVPQWKKDLDTKKL